ncbi:MAG: arylsulfatase [Phycisphaeraceae bacterium]
MFRLPLVAFCLFLTALAAFPARAADAAKPNIIYILADDMGYGDVKALNKDCKIATPHLDRLAREGMIFTDAHSSSAVCTPTRYGILTGRYNWRTKLQNGVLGGYSRPLIAADRLTVASFLKQHGYRTAAIGKWHLGMDWPLKDGNPADDKGDFAGGYGDAWKVDYTQPIQNGPNDAGFDYYFGISASLDMPPYLFIRNRLVTAVPTLDRELWPRRKGPSREDFHLEDVLPAFASEAVKQINEGAAEAKKGKPLFVYMPLNSPHTPIAPSKEWKGKSGIGSYGDFVMETDWAVGQVLEAIDRNGLADNTLLIFTSDNGCSPQADFVALAKHGHNPSYLFRGYKADIFDGGHRIPFIARWPGKIAPGSISDQTICLTDLMATCAEIVAAKLPDTAGEDSVSLVPAFTGKATAPLHEAVVHHSINGSFSIRQGQWKLVLCADSGGWSAPRPGAKGANDQPAMQLFDLSKDVGEETNVMAAHPEVVDRLTKVLERFVADGRSTPGVKQKNDVTVNIYRHVPK